jgi:hypothetical protein
MDPIIPASPSSPSLSSDEAWLIYGAFKSDSLAIRDDFKKRMTSLEESFDKRFSESHSAYREDINGVRSEVLLAREDAAQATFIAFQRVADDMLTNERRAEIFRIEMREYARRGEERMSHLVRASQRHESALIAIQAREDRTEVDIATPWFLRPATWRPVVIATAFAIVASALTACATVSFLNPGAIAVSTHQGAP